MDAHDTHDIAERVEDAGGRAIGFRRGVALLVGVMAMLLAIASLGGENAMKETINANILASDTYAFYQARNIRQEMLAATADLLETLGKDAAPYRVKADREAKEKSGLLEEARRHDAERATAQRRDINFDYARALYEIAIVLGSVSIVAGSRPLVGLSALLALCATALSANGFLLAV